MIRFGVGLPGPFWWTPGRRPRRRPRRQGHPVLVALFLFWAAMLAIANWRWLVIIVCAAVAVFGAGYYIALGCLTVMDRRARRENGN